MTCVRNDLRQRWRLMAFWSSKSPFTYLDHEPRCLGVPELSAVPQACTCDAAWRRSGLTVYPSTRQFRWEIYGIWFSLSAITLKNVSPGEKFDAVTPLTALRIFYGYKT